MRCLRLCLKQALFSKLEEVQRCVSVIPQMQLQMETLEQLLLSLNSAVKNALVKPPASWPNADDGSTDSDDRFQRTHVLTSAAAGGDYTSASASAASCAKDTSGSREPANDIEESASADSSPRQQTDGSCSEDAASVRERQQRRRGSPAGAGERAWSVRMCMRRGLDIVMGMRAGDPRLGLEKSAVVHPESPFNIGQQLSFFFRGSWERFASERGRRSV